MAAKTIAVPAINTAIWSLRSLVMACLHKGGLERYWSFRVPEPARQGRELGSG
jgi:hypothetical protein